MATFVIKCRLLRVIVGLLVLIVAQNASAQSFGLSALLNPEGSRLFPQPVVYPRHPGKPDPRWKTFKWFLLDRVTPAPQTTKYRLYFYESEEWSARFAIPRLERQITELTKLFNGYSPRKEFAYLLFTSLSEFQQANIFFVSEGVQGITSTTEATMAIPFWGEAATFEHISKHELTHQFQVQKINDIGGVDSLSAMARIPLWFIEGMAEYYSLDGLDDETRAYVRDLMLFPDDKRDHKMPKLFDEGPLNFINIYKMGQARIHFFETEFGPGTAQRLLETAASPILRGRVLFATLVADALKTGVLDLESKWTTHLEKTYKTAAETLKQSPDSYERIEAAGDTLDYFRVSPDAGLIAIREIDQLESTTYIRLLDAKTNKQVATVAKSNEPDRLSLFFFQNPTIALSNNVVAYAVATTNGPEIEWRTIKRDDDGDISLGSPERLVLHENNGGPGLIQISSVAISPDENQIAFVGLTPKGWANVYTANLRGSAAVRQLTNEAYAWRTLSWGSDGILGASDRTSNLKFGIFHLDPQSANITKLHSAPQDLLSPEGTRTRFTFQSWATGSSQAHLYENGKERRLTAIKTMLLHPQERLGALYALGFKSGRYHLYRIGPEQSLKEPLSIASVNAPPWVPVLANFPSIGTQKYEPFRSQKLRVENLVAFFGSGNAGGIAGEVSDLMRNYTISAEFFALGSFKYSSGSAFLSSSEGRTTWLSGAYFTTQARLDTVIDDDFARTYLYREAGVLGVLQYPLGAFTYVDFELRLGGVKRGDLDDPARVAEWNSKNPGTEFLASPMVRLGYDRILYELYTGPLQGYGLLLESDTSVFPGRQSLSQRLRLDGSLYIQAVGRTVIAFQTLAGASFGGTFNNPFFVSSDDILRAYPFGDDRLRANYVAAGKAELRFPIGTFFGFPPLRGLVGYDYGTLFNRKNQVERNITSSLTGGINLNIPPIALSFLLSNPLRVAPGETFEEPVIHFLFRYLYL